MESLRELFRIGHGPSSSHTMGPRFAAERFKAQYPRMQSCAVTLFGSLAATGKGHQTDQTIINALMPVPTEIIWKPETVLPEHPNGMIFEAIVEGIPGKAAWKVFSVGGGKIKDFSADEKTVQVYDLASGKEILSYIRESGQSLWEYVLEKEGEIILPFLSEIWQTMSGAVQRGLESEGLLPGKLKLTRKASSYYHKVKHLSATLNDRSLVYAYALAVAEENASGGLVVTAPTCGSSGVLPAVLRLLKDHLNVSDVKIARALATAGLFGNLVKTNGSISGADVGCQGEIGTACAMASAAATQLLGGTPAQIEYAAEMGLEHHLGLTCDPIAGLVQIPCIERNAFAAARALDIATYALLSDGQHLISFDKIVKTMKQTGHDLPYIYKETSRGGMALIDPS